MKLENHLPTSKAVGAFDASRSEKSSILAARLSLEVPVVREKDEAQGGWMSVLENAWTTDFLRYLFKMGASKQRQKVQKDMGQVKFACRMKGENQRYSPRPWFAMLSCVPMLFFWAMWRHHHYGPVLSLLSLFLYVFMVWKFVVVVCIFLRL